jgi:hypothetical protein
VTECGGRSLQTSIPGSLRQVDPTRDQPPKRTCCTAAVSGDGAAAAVPAWATPSPVPSGQYSRTTFRPIWL